MKYDLLTESWIPALDLQGVTNEYSILSLLEAAPKLKRIVHEKPLVVASVQRLLLAILYRSYGYLEPDEWDEVFAAGEFDEQVSSYLDSAECAERFDLFSESNPFFQTANFTKEKGVTTSVKKLSPDLASGNNKTLFNHIADNHEFSLPANEAALQLLVCQYFSLGGGVSGSSVQFGKHPNLTNAPLVGGAVVMVEGENLFQTLMLNLHMPKNEEWLDRKTDLPVWEQNEPEQPQAREMRGLSDYLTWRARHVRLLPQKDGSVARMFIAQGLPNPKEMEQEPYFAYRLNKEQKKLPIRLSFERAYWRDTANLLQYARSTKVGIEPTDLRPAGIQLLAAEDNELIDKLHLNCQLIGLDNNKANPLCWFDERLPLAINLIEKDQVQKNKYSAHLVKGLETAEAINSQLMGAVRTFASHLLPDGARAQDISTKVESINPARFYWPKLNESFEQFIWALSNNSEEAKSSWRTVCKETAFAAFEGATHSWCYGGVRAQKGLSIAKQQLEESLHGRTWQRHVYWSQDTQEIIRQLYQWGNPDFPKRDILAALRKSLDLQKGSQLTAISYLGPLLSSEDERSKVQAFIAGLFASHAKVYQEAQHSSFGHIWYQADKDQRRGMSFRFECLLEAKGEQLKQTLRQMVQILKSKDIAIDYRTLMEDLYHWDSDDKRIQLKWARDYWAKPTQSDESTDSADATN
ncbi:type I-E CRISPR-associated protein Cse1/CasA [Pseudoalteromonas sp. CO348]|uniref:type I-E CRISPR-associated protein Cse1/CasA n=1 Tax=unclassified Pseudoalteromonas TaxID=194690 RepID=UPI0010234BCF|nr:MULTISPECIES: type I-E CRISPR-associated protein Cse1/CasA [unclassified Pseudoalteromonas]MCG7540340.1 type I-E CRISPR-associated protein Cse1/CasA [Pseudoalteromonas sp. OF7H-1]RZF98566.1 type I-E CRISPR-associated protein Cse1/CasA [Pseudoalteromonas sp. CO348]